MPTRIRIVYRVIRTVRIQVPLAEITHLPSVCVLGYESSVLRIVISRIQVVETCLLIVDTACVADLVVEGASCYLSGLSKVNVGVCCRETSSFI